MSGRGYIISFAIFFACLFAVLMITGMNSYQKRIFSAQIRDEIEANNLFLAKKVISNSYENVYTNYSYCKWSSTVREYCRSEGLDCSLEEKDRIVVRISEKSSRMKFSLPKRR